MEADQRAVAALAALEAMQPDNFHGGDSFWAACLLQRGRLYRRRIDGQLFISMGFETYCSLGWKVELISHDGINYFRSPKDASVGSLELLRCTAVSVDDSSADTEPFQGIPFELRFLGSPSNLKF